jgi:hypothetical protein
MRMANAGSSDDWSRQRNVLRMILIGTHHERVECVLIVCEELLEEEANVV